jgi:hypothetical protein
MDRLLPNYYSRKDSVNLSLENRTNSESNTGSQHILKIPKHLDIDFAN